MKVLSDALFKNKVLMNDKEVVPTSIEKWNIALTQYGVDISKEDVFKVCFKTTTDSSVQWLHFEFYTEYFQLGIILEKLI